MDRVPFLDVGAARRELARELDAALGRVADSGWFILGRELAAFEACWAAYTGAAYAVGTGNGLDALHLALLAAGVGPGDEVVVPSNTYIATWLAVTHAGAKPVPAEPDTATFNLDPGRFRAAITPRTKAVVAVHLYGQPADMDEINQVARAHHIFVLEDAAQAHGAHYKRRAAGSLGDAAAWSFYPSKNLGAMGDGGAVTTDNEHVADEVRRLRNYGSTTKYVNEVAGYNSRLDELQAAVLAVKVQALDRWNKRRQIIAAQYLEGLAETDLGLPFVPSWASPAWHVFVVRSARRDALRSHLDALGIDTVIHYPVPPHLQGAYAHLGFKRGAFPISEAIHDEALSLPMGPHLRQDEVDRVIAATAAFRV